jgi:hypothetical protein
MPNNRAATPGALLYRAALQMFALNWTASHRLDSTWPDILFGGQRNNPDTQATTRFRADTLGGSQ